MHNSATPRSAPATSGLSKAERLILTVLAQYPKGRTTVQIAILTGYAVNGGGFRNALGSLNSKGYIERSAIITISDAGLKALGPFEPLPTGRALLDYWLQQLTKAESLSLAAIAAAYPRRITVEDVAKTAGYEAKGGGFRNALGKLRTLQLIRASVPEYLASLSRGRVSDVGGRLVHYIGALAVPVPSR